MKRVRYSVGKDDKTINLDYGICICCEKNDNSLELVSLELVSKGAEMAKILETKVSAIIINGCESDFQELFECGANLICNFSADRYSFQYLDVEIVVSMISDFIKKYFPQIMLIGATSFGRQIAPCIAALNNTGLTADCIKIDVDEVTKKMLQTRPAQGERVIATILCEKSYPQMATVRPGIFKAKHIFNANRGVLLNIKVENSKIEFKSTLMKYIEINQNKNPSKKRIVVAGGLGIGTKKNFGYLKRLAEMIDADVGATRPVVEKGWVDMSKMIGQTGKSVYPELYLAFGISGAIQHRIGYEHAKTIIAINNDRNAPIFSDASFGVIDDAVETIKKIIRTLEVRNGR